MSYFNSSEKIITHFENRLSNINKTFYKLDDLYKNDIDIELLKQIYINYYLCFSSAIESFTRLFVMCESSSNEYVISKLAFKNESRPYLFIENDMKLLIGINTIDSVTSKDYYQWFRKKVSIIKDDEISIYDAEKKLFDFESFDDVYKALRKARNVVAHSLSLNTRFGNDVIIRFSKVLYLLQLHFS